MYGDGLRTCAPVKFIKTSQQVSIGFKNLPAAQRMGSNEHLAIETSIKNLIKKRKKEKQRKKPRMFHYMMISWEVFALQCTSPADRKGSLVL